MYMRIKCENVVICGNYKCKWNCEGRCDHDVIVLDHNGWCTLEDSEEFVKPDDCTVNESF